jgi:hypothetical protein
MSPATRQSRTYRGYRIVVLQLGETWNGILYAPPNWSIVAADIDGASAQEAIVKAMRVVDATQPTRVQRAAHSRHGGAY